MTTITAPARWLRRQIGSLAAPIFLAFVGFSSVSAQEAGDNFFLDKRLYFAVGGFFPAIDSEVELDPDQIGSGTSFDVEDALGLDEDSSSFWLQARWRFARHHLIELEGINLSRDGLRNINRTLVIGNVQANVGAQVDTELDLAIGRVTYGWSFIKDKRKEATLLAGAHVTRAKASFTFTGSIQDANSGAPLSGTVVEESDITLPLPHVGGRFGYAISPRLVADAGVMAFYVKIGDVKGSLIELQANIRYLVWENVALGTGFRYFNVNIEEDKTNGRDEYDYNYWGPVVFLSASF